MGTSVIELKISRVMKTGFIALALALTAAGCSKGLQQDPYADQSDAVKNRIPPEKNTAPPVGKAVGAEVLRIDSADSLTFDEGQEGQAQITGRVLMDINGHTPVLGTDYELSIDNIADFPGATFDAPTGTFTWTPRRGYVQGSYTRNIHVDVTLTTKGSPILRTTRSIIGIVTCSSIEPTIVSIEDLNVTPLHEGEARIFKVVVNDPHGDDKDDMRPRLTIVASDNGQPTAANLITLQKTWGVANPQRDPGNPTQWIFTLVLDLQNKEITTGKTVLGFGLIATSRFGEASAIKLSSATVITSIGDPLMSWAQNEPIDVVQGKENTINFSIFDPRSESNMTVNFDTRCDITLGIGSTCTCKAQAAAAGVNTQLCTIRWSVPPTATGQYRIDISSFNQSRYDAQQKKTTFSRFLRVVIPGQPPAPFVLPADLQPAKVNAVNVNAANANLGDD